MSRDDFFRYAPLIALVIFLALKFYTARPDTTGTQAQTLLRQGATLVDVRSAGNGSSRRRTAPSTGATARSPRAPSRSTSATTPASTSPPTSTWSIA